MFERFTEKARRVIFFARYEASQFGSSVIETEHLLLGIAREAKDLLNSVGGPDTTKRILETTRQRCPAGEKISTSVELPLSESTKNVLNAAMKEADQGGDKGVGTKHLLIGLLREEGCLAQKILNEVGVTLESIRHHPGFRGEQPAENFPWKQVIGKSVPDDSFRKVVTDAIEEAAVLRSMAAKPEHLLLALLRNKQSTAGTILRAAGLDYDGVRKQLE